MILSSILDRVGNTPLVKIREVTRDLPKSVEIYAKLEYFNPGGSVKDRAAYWMIKEGIRLGKLTRDKIIMDPTSGNTGVAYAMIGAALGYKVTLVMPQNASQQRKDIARAFGADIIFSSPFEGSDGAIRMAHKLYEENPGKFFMPDQYNNPFNPQAHYESTGVEIWNQTEGKITHFLATMGTSGTAMGTTRRLKDFDKNIFCIGAQPADSLHGLEGLKHMPTSIVPGIYHPEILDEMMWIQTESSYDMVERLGKEEGLLVGYSSGAAMVACLKLAERIAKGVIVTVFPDHGDRYFEGE
ncbi:MAG TPA: cysteine synthase [Deltaproteobacteria bacterium]|nr:MAG: cysteine synthase [Deltaproteobacteria bacterium GWA2_45_12]HBF12678.1 cysteine synthase [Deltaproteobacteria bacterium]